MTFKRDDPRPQLNIRVDQDWMDGLDVYVEESGKTKTEVVLEAVTAILPSNDSKEVLPEDLGLRKTYLWLRENSDPYGRIGGMEALPGLAQHLGMRKKLVRKSRLQHLERRGWITARKGRIQVLRRVNFEEEA